MTTLTEIACAVLGAGDPAAKLALTRDAGGAWNGIGDARPPERPARPDRPHLLAPREMPRRSFGGQAGRIALFHALAHIELNAVDLAWDIIARFAEQDLPEAFFVDWLSVAVDEAEHFALLERHLAQMGATYGDLPAHDGLWQAAEKTVGDLLARLAIVPLVLEARGLDTTPNAMARLEAQGDHGAISVLDRIYQDEIKHVRIGTTWFRHVAQARNLDPRQAFQDCIRRDFKGGLKAPFNHEARALANFPRDWYEPLAA